MKMHEFCPIFCSVFRTIYLVKGFRCGVIPDCPRRDDKDG